MKLFKIRPKVTLDIEPDAPGHHWATALVGFCNDAPQADPETGEDVDHATVGWDPWLLLDRDGGRWAAWSEGTVPDSWPAPTYPMYGDAGSTVKIGECVRGWIAFPVADGSKVTQVRYSPEGSGSATWAV